MIDYDKFLRRLSFLLIMLAMIIFLLDYIKVIERKPIYEGITISLFFASFIIDLLRDLKISRYTTYKLIIIIDIVKLILFACLVYFGSLHYDKSDIKHVFQTSSRIQWCGVLIGLMETLKLTFENPKYERNLEVENEND